MKLIYYKETGDYLVVKEDEYEKNVFMIISKGNTGEEALEKALVKMEECLKYCISLLTNIGGIISDRASFVLDRECLYENCLEQIKLNEEEIEIDEEGFDSYSFLILEDNEYKPFFD